jgi:hypothetical protein
MAQLVERNECAGCGSDNTAVRGRTLTCKDCGICYYLSGAQIVKRMKLAALIVSQPRQLAGKPRVKR